MQFQSWRRNIGLLGFAALVFAGCGGDSMIIEPPPPQPPIAAELQGGWSTVIGTGERVRLSLSPTRYQIVRGPNRAAGLVTGHDDQIEFFQSNLCVGTGTYRWSLNGNSLTFNSLGEACPGRAEVLAEQTYTRGD